MPPGFRTLFLESWGWGVGEGVGGGLHVFKQRLSVFTFAV